jgi:hypothetical protein
MAASWIASKSPGFAGAALGMLIGVGLFGYGMWTFFAPTPTPMPQSIALVVAGFVNWISCFYTMRRIRVAWAFALSLNGTGSVLFLFGAPKVRDAFETNLGIGILPMVLFLATTVLLAAASDEMEKAS